MTVVTVAATVTAWLVLFAVHGRPGDGGHGSGGHSSGAHGGGPHRSGDHGGAGQAIVVGPDGAASSLLPQAGHSGGLLDLAGQAGPDLAHWAVMCVAMMLPVALPGVRHVAARSLRRRRPRAAALFLAAYLAVWVAVGVVALAVAWLVQGVVPTGALIVGLVVSVPLWQLTRAQTYARAACHRTVPLPPRGRRADTACLRFGLLHGAACVGVCGPSVGLMAVSLHAHPLWMVPLAALGAALRLAPRRYRPPALVDRLRVVADGLVTGRSGVRWT